MSQNLAQQDVVMYYKVKGLGHALLIDPAKCEQQGGKHKLFSADKNFYSTYWTAVDFGLISPHSIIGKSKVKPYEQNVTFSVPTTDGVNYIGSFPKGCKLISKSANSVNVNWRKVSGSVNVTVMNNTKFKTVFQTLFVTAEY